MLQVLGHELRWKLADQLSRSDLKVGELTEATGEAQNLVSYHLRLLRDAGVVHERRSSADGRDIYYTLDRAAVTKGLLGAIASLNPGAARPGPGDSARPLRRHVASVLFLCTGNSARSQIAEAMLGGLGWRHVIVRSAGTHPTSVHPQVFEVLESRGLRSGNLRSKSITEFADRNFDYVVTLCDIARTESIQWSGKPRRLHWSIPDPVSARGGRGAVAKAFGLVADEIEVRVREFYGELRARPSGIGVEEST